MLTPEMTSETKPVMQDCVGIYSLLRMLADEDTIHTAGHDQEILVQC